MEERYTVFNVGPSGFTYEGWCRIHKGGLLNPNITWSECSMFEDKLYFVADLVNTGIYAVDTTYFYSNTAVYIDSDIDDDQIIDHTVDEQVIAFHQFQLPTMNSILAAVHEKETASYTFKWWDVGGGVQEAYETLAASSEFSIISATGIETEFGYATFFGLSEFASILPVECYFDTGSGTVVVGTKIVMGVGTYTTLFMAKQNLIATASLSGAAIGLKMSLLKTSSAEFTPGIESIFFASDDVTSGQYDAAHGVYYFLLKRGGILKLTDELSEVYTMEFTHADFPSPYFGDGIAALAIDVSNNYGYFGLSSRRKIFAEDAACSYQNAAFYNFIAEDDYYNLGMNAPPMIGNLKGLTQSNLTMEGNEQLTADSDDGRYSMVCSNGPCHLKAIGTEEKMVEKCSTTLEAAVLFSVKPKSLTTSHRGNIISYSSDNSDLTNNVRLAIYQDNSDMIFTWQYAKPFKYALTSSDYEWRFSNFFTSNTQYHTAGVQIFKGNRILVWNSESHRTTVWNMQKIRGVNVAVYGGITHSYVYWGVQDLTSTEVVIGTQPWCSGEAIIEFHTYPPMVTDMYFRNSTSFDTFPESTSTTFNMIVSGMYKNEESNNYNFRITNTAGGSLWFDRDQFVSSGKVALLMPTTSNPLCCFFKPANPVVQTGTRNGVGVGDHIFLASNYHNGYASPYTWDVEMKKTSESTYATIPDDKMYTGFGVTYDLVTFHAEAIEDHYPKWDPDTDSVTNVVTGGYSRVGMAPHPIPLSTFSPSCSMVDGYRSCEFMVHYYGYLDIQQKTQFQMFATSCEGVVVEIDGVAVINSPWSDHDDCDVEPCKRIFSGDFQMTYGLRRIDVWFLGYRIENPCDIQIRRVHNGQEVFTWVRPEMWLRPIDWGFADAWDSGEDYRINMFDMEGVAADYSWEGNIRYAGIYYDYLGDGRLQEEMNGDGFNDGCFVSDFNPSLNTQHFMDFVLANCGDYSDCSTCVNSDPSCSWCLPSLSCVALGSECSGGGGTMVTECPAITSFEPASGPATGGYNITINGIHLDEAKSLYVENTLVSDSDRFFIDDSKEIVTVPNFALLGYSNGVNVTYRNGDMTSWTDPRIFYLFECSESNSNPPCGFCVTTHEWTTVGVCPADDFVLGGKPTLSSVVTPSLRTLPARGENVTVEISGVYLDWDETLKCVFTTSGSSSGTYETIAASVSAYRVSCPSPVNVDDCYDFASCSATVHITRYDSLSMTYISLSSDTLSISFYDCNVYSTSCSSCSDSSDTPLCGWCLADALCETKTECTANGMTSDSEWGRDYVSSFLCPIVDTIDPSKGAFAGTTNIDIELDGGKFVSYPSYECKFTHDGDPDLITPASVLQEDTLRCVVSNADTAFSGETVTTLSVQIASSQGTYAISPRNFKFFNCSSYTTCKTCERPERPMCGWCLDTGTCGIESACTTPSNWRSTGQCPKLFEDSMIDIGKDVALTVEFSGSNLIDGFVTCKFVNDSDVVIADTAGVNVDGDVITCSVTNGLGFAGIYQANLVYVYDTDRLYATDSRDINVIDCDATYGDRCLDCLYAGIGCGFDREKMKCTSDNLASFYSDEVSVACPILEDWSPRAKSDDSSPEDVTVDVNGPPPTSLRYFWMNVSNVYNTSALDISSVSVNSIILPIPAIVLDYVSAWNLILTTSVAFGEKQFLVIEKALEVFTCSSFLSCASCGFHQDDCGWDGGGGSCKGDPLTWDDPCPYISTLSPTSGNYLDDSFDINVSGLPGTPFASGTLTCRFEFGASSFVETAAVGAAADLTCPPPPDTRSMRASDSGNVSYEVSVYKDSHLLTLNDGNPYPSYYYTTYDCAHIGEREFVDYEACVAAAGSLDCFWNETRSQCEFDSGGFSSPPFAPVLTSLNPYRVFVYGQVGVKVEGSYLGSGEDLFIQIGTVGAVYAAVYQSGSDLYVDMPPRAAGSKEIFIVKSVSGEQQKWGGYYELSSAPTSSVSVLYFDCPALTCSDCLSLSSSECGWCWVDGSSVCADNGTCTNSLSGSFVPQGTGNCPSILGSSITEAPAGVMYDVTINGTDFVPTASLSRYGCKFGSSDSYDVTTLVTAGVDDSLLCRMNVSSTTDPVSISVFFDGFEFDNPNSLQFDYYACNEISSCATCLDAAPVCGWCFSSPGGCELESDCTDSTTYWNTTICPEFASIEPDTGSMLGGTNVSLTGSNFLSGIDLVCSIEDVRVNAIFVNDTTLVCEMPLDPRGGGIHDSQLYLYYDVGGQKYEYDPEIPPSVRDEQVFTYYPCSGTECSSCVSSFRSECVWCHDSANATFPYFCSSSTACVGATLSFEDSCPDLTNIVPASAPIGYNISSDLFGHQFPSQPLYTFFDDYLSPSTQVDTSSHLIVQTPTSSDYPSFEAISEVGMREYTVRVYKNSDKTNPFVEDTIAFYFYVCNDSSVDSIGKCIDPSTQQQNFLYHTLDLCGWCLTSGGCELTIDPSACPSGLWLTHGSDIPTVEARSLSPSTGPVQGGTNSSFTAYDLNPSASYFIRFGYPSLAGPRRFLKSSPIIAIPVTVSYVVDDEYLVEFTTPEYEILGGAYEESVQMYLMSGYSISDNHELVYDASLKFKFYDCRHKLDCGECITDGGAECGWCVTESTCDLKSTCPSAETSWVTDVNSCPSITSITPESGATLGETSVMVHGVNFVDTGNLTCSFGIVSSNVKFVNETVVVCETPAVDGSTIASFKLHNQGTRQFTKNIKYFKFYDCEANIDSCSVCIFSTRPECGYCKSTTMCTVSHSCPPGDFIDERANCPTVTSFAPTKAANDGGTTVRVNGTQFVDGLKCGFNGTLVPTTFDVATQSLTCQTPNDSSAADVDFAVYGLKQDLVITVWEAYAIGSTKFEFYDCPVYSACDGCLSSTHDECGWNANEMACTVGRLVPSTDTFWPLGSPCPAINRIVPSSMDIAGGDEVVIYGDVFLPDITLTCVFGSRRSTARYVDSGRIKCKVPEGNDEGQVEFWLYQGDRPYVPKSNRFSYTEEKSTTPAGAIVAGVLTPFAIFGWMAHDVVWATAFAIFMIIGFLFNFKVLLIGRKKYKRYKFYKQLKPPNWNEVIFKNELDVNYDISGREHLLETIEDVLKKTDQKFPLCVCAACDSSEADRMAKHLAFLFESEGGCGELLKGVIKREVELTVQLNTLFRTNSLATKLFKSYSNMYALPYLFDTLSKGIFLLSLEHKDDEKSKDDKRLASFSQAQQQTETDIEVDRSKIINISNGTEACENGDENDVDEEAKEEEKKTAENMSKFKLLLSCQEFLTTIMKSLPDVPWEIRDVLESVKEDTLARFGDEHATIIAIGGFFFLRFVCPAIMTPEAHGLLKEVPSAKLRRHLTLVAKVLQNLANGVEFTKEEYMIKMNDFISTNLKGIEKYFLKLATAPAEPSSRAIRVIPESTRVNSICFMYNFILEHKDKVLEMSQTFDDPAFVELFSAYIEMLIGKVGEPFPKVKKS